MKLHPCDTGYIISGKLVRSFVDYPDDFPASFCLYEYGAAAALLLAPKVRDKITNIARTIEMLLQPWMAFAGAVQTPEL
jgi:hypothetical protein